MHSQFFGKFFLRMVGDENKNSSPQDGNRAMFTGAGWGEERLDSIGAIAP
jgi:hypothetical protein